MMYDRLWRGGISAWVVTVVGFGVFAGAAIEHPAYLSMPLWPFAFGMSIVIVGLPLALGLAAVQIPAFVGTISKGRGRRRAWINSALANAGYAALLTAPATLFAWLFGNQPQLTIRPLLILVGCSLATSAIWFTCNELFSRTRNA